MALNCSNNRRKRLLFSLILFFLVVTFCSLVYIGSVLVRSRKMWSVHPRWIGSAYEKHADYGHFPRPNNIAYHSLKYGEKVPVLFDDRAFRAPVGEDATTNDLKKILFLGSSFTHGYGLPAEKTFAHLSATSLSMECMNAAGSGWGLAHMVLRARHEIPKHKPDYVIVEHSRWVIERSMRSYGIGTYGLIARPFFYESKGNIRIHKPLFAMKSLTLPIEEYAQKSFLSFFWTVGLPLYVHNDWQVVSILVRQKIGALPYPAGDKERIVYSAYDEIQQLCIEHDAKMLVLKLYQHWWPLNSTKDLSDRFHVVDTLPPLDAELHEKTRAAWSRKYHFWRGQPPQIVDTHMNSEANVIIAKAIHDAVSLTARLDP